MSDKRRRLDRLGPRGPYDDLSDDELIETYLAAEAELKARAVALLAVAQAAQKGKP